MSAKLPTHAQIPTDEPWSGFETAPWTARRFVESFLGGAPLPVKIAHDWEIKEIVAVPDAATPAVLIYIAILGGPIAHIIVAPLKKGLDSAASTRWLNLSHPRKPKKEALALLDRGTRALANFITAYEPGAEEPRPDISSFAERVTSHGELLLSPEGLLVDSDGNVPPQPEPEAKGPDRGRPWPCDAEGFKRSFLGDAEFPLDLGAGFQVNSLISDRVDMSLLADVTGDGDLQFKVIIEPKCAFENFAQTRFLNLSHLAVPESMDLNEVMRGGLRLAEYIYGIEATVTPQEAERIFSVPQPEPLIDDIEGRSTSESTPGEWRPVQLRINRECNEYCLFCNTPEDYTRILEDKATVLQQIEDEYSRGYRQITFTGREPTLDANLAEYIGVARDRGYQQIRIQTNATALANATLLKTLVDAGLTSVQVSMHTYNADTFEKLVGKRTLLPKTLLGIHNVLEYPELQCFFLFVITTLNLSEMEDFVRTTVAEFGTGIDFVLFSPMAPMGDGAKNLQLLPPLGEISTMLQRTFSAAETLGLSVNVPARCGLPLCATPEEYRHLNDESINEEGENYERNKSKPDQCADCSYETRCTGVWDLYLDTRGDEHITPIA